MAPWLLIAVGCVYAYIAIDFARTNQPGMALCFAGYAFSNVGLWMAAK